MAQAVLVTGLEPRRIAAGQGLSGKSGLQGSVQSLWRHPVKGFTPERLDEVVLSAGLCFPADRLYAVEDGPSGFDPTAPRHISKQKFTVLAKIAAVARIRTRYDDKTGVLEAALDGHPPLRAPLGEADGRAAFAAWLAAVLGDEVSGPLKVLPAPGDHRFMDDERGYVSIINLASLRDLEARIGRPVDPRRFRANLYVEGWPAWAENEAAGRVRLGEVEAELVKPIKRCVATHVDPNTGDRDIDVVRALFEAYGHMNCGIYVNVTGGGRLKVGEPAVLGG
jgi:hypothetical protein